ncbi:MAG: PIN domain-containing protein [Lachnospiraceae bacterium]|jgi:predicted nucleic acid-binding protein|nr:PIN domain-containing protein [Lachnospiraceae bacterium]
MTILVDTNIVLDVLMKREPYAELAQIIMTKCADREIIGYLAAHSIPNLFYILRKTYTIKERRRLIKNLCNVFRISDLNEKKILSAVENEEFSDFEDCLQEECAVEAMVDYIVTRNPDDYAKSRIKVVEPREFVALL